MGGVGGVLHDAVGFAGASCKENVQDGWERGIDEKLDTGVLGRSEGYTKPGAGIISG